MAVDPDALDLPAEVAERLHPLGPPLQVFAMSQRKLSFQLFLGGLALLVGVVLDAVCVVSLFLAVRQGGFQLGKGIVVLFLVGVLLITAGVRIPVRAFRQKGLLILLYAEGLVRILDNRAEAFQFDQIAVFRQITRGELRERLLEGTRRYQIELRDGRQFAFDSTLPGLQQLGEVLRREVVRQLLPRSLADLEAGRVLLFAKLNLHRNGIYKEQELLPWTDVQSVAVSFTSGEVKVHRRGAWFAWYDGRDAEFPNLPVFAALAQYALEEWGKAEAPNEKAIRSDPREPVD